MSGSTESCPVSRRIEDLERELDRQLSRLALPPVKPGSESEVTALLGVTRAEIRGMSAEECSEAAILLSSQSFFLQRRHNRLQAVVDWCEEAIQQLIAEVVVVQKGWGYPERRALSIRQNETARKFSVAQLTVRTQAKDIEHLSLRVEHRSNLFDRLSRIKEKQHG